MWKCLVWSCWNQDSKLSLQRRKKPSGIGTFKDSSGNAFTVFAPPDSAAPVGPFAINPGDVIQNNQHLRCISHRATAFFLASFDTWFSSLYSIPLGHRLLLCCKHNVARFGILKTGAQFQETMVLTWGKVWIDLTFHKIIFTDWLPEQVILWIESKWGYLSDFTTSPS